MALSENGFGEYRRLILDKLEVIGQDVKLNRAQIARMEVDMASLKTQARIQSAFYGVLGGAVAAIGAVLLQLLS